MPGNRALVNFNRCRPEMCEKGICKAVQACRYKLLIQEKSHDVPLSDPFICRGCGDCVRVCPLKAIEITNN